MKEKGNLFSNNINRGREAFNARISIQRWSFEEKLYVYYIFSSGSITI
ncbi:hypothetical protein NC651_013880 [Populus alba x Populus x berolinensis]|nr:hypothetical protein NC651_013880 [Populus alba x Populus x berolinensis]